MSIARSILLNGLFLLAFLAISFIAITELTSKAVVIEPIQVPKSLQEKGYFGDIAAIQLIEAIEEILRAPMANNVTRQVRISRDLKNLQFFVLNIGEPSKILSETVVPGFGVSFRAFLQHVRQFFKLHQVRIAGEFFCGQTKCEPNEFDLRIRIIKDRTRILKLDKMGFSKTQENYIRAGIEVLKQIDAYSAASYYSQHNEEEELRIAEKIVRDGQYDAKWALNLMGLIYAKRGEHDQAIKAYIRAIEKDRNFAVAHTNLGNSLADKGDVDGAIEKYETAAEIDPKSAFAYVNWGAALERKGDVSGAIAKYKRAVERDPNYADPYLNWGRALAGKGSFESAIAKYAKVAEIDPNSPLLYVYWGRALVEKGDLDGALEKYVKAAELDPGFAIAYTHWGHALDRKGNLDAAIKKFQQAIRLDPNSASAYYNWGRVLVEKGDIKSAITKFDQIQEIDRKSELP